MPIYGQRKDYIMAYIINISRTETRISTTTTAHGVRFRFEFPCTDDGQHEYSEYICPKCGRDFCFACCGGTNVDQGGKYEEDFMYCPGCGHDIYSEPENQKLAVCDVCGQTAGFERHCCAACGASCGLTYGCGSDDCHTHEPVVGNVLRQIDSRYDNLTLIEADNGFFSEERVCLSDTCACNSHPRYWVREIDRASFCSMAKSPVEANQLEDWDPSVDGPRYWDGIKCEAVIASSVATIDICYADIQDGVYLEGGSAWDVGLTEVKVVLHSSKWDRPRLVNGWVNDGTTAVLVREEYDTTANGMAKRIECPPGHLLIETSHGSPSSFASFRLFSPDKFRR